MRSVNPLILASIALDVLLLDQLSKYLVIRSMPLNTEKVLLPFFSLAHVRNTGAAFGMFNDSNRAFIVLTFAILTLLAFLHRRLAAEGRLTAVGVACLWGGALGNLADRFRLGGVTDFLDFHWGVHHWHTFNVADSAITAGVSLMFLQNLLRARKDRP
jgi:signal peptidase II